MNGIIEKLLEYQDTKQGDFIAKLTPTIPREKFIGVKVPNIRLIAKDILYEEAIKFMNNLPHNYYEEDLLHGFLLSKIKNFNELINQIEKFLPYVNNWAVSDTMAPKILKKYTDDYLPYVKKWIKSSETYTIRYAIVSLMTFYMDDKFSEEYNKIVSSIKSNEYYVKIAVAWYFATALTKQYDLTIKIIKNKELDKWTHNKAIQKAIESYRVSEEQKEYLRTLKI